MLRDIFVNSFDGLPGVSGGRALALLFYTIPPRLPPASWTLIALISGNRLPIRTTHTLAVVAGFVEPCGTVTAAFLDDDLV